MEIIVARLLIMSGSRQSKAEEGLPPQYLPLSVSDSALLLTAAQRARVGDVRPGCADDPDIRVTRAFLVILLVKIDSKTVLPRHARVAKGFGRAPQANGLSGPFGK